MPLRAVVPDPPQPIQIGMMEPKDRIGRRHTRRPRNAPAFKNSPRTRSRPLERTHHTLVSEDDADLWIASGKPAELAQAFHSARAIAARPGARRDVPLELPMRKWLASPTRSVGGVPFTRYDV